MGRVSALLSVLALEGGLGGCGRNKPTQGREAPRPARETAADGAVSDGLAARSPPRLAANLLAALVREKPDPTSPILGYLRLGAVVERDPDPAGNDRCPKGWYRIRPQGYVCVGKGGTLDPNEPIVVASQKRPDRASALPYRYAFVRAVAPLYLRVPAAEEQLKTEFKLRQHLSYWGRHGEEDWRAEPGANEALLGLDSPEGGSKSRPGPIGVLLGGQSDNDPIPTWLAGGRRIPNIAPPPALPPSSNAYSDRARRHTGVALVGSFPTGRESLERRFAVTVDMRLLPGDKLKPETASAFHGVSLTSEMTLPLAFVRGLCKSRACVRAYEIDASGVRPVGDPLESRSLLRLTGKKRLIAHVGYHEMSDGRWVRANDAAVAEMPTDWPPGAKSGKKWIEVSIMDESLVLWEGQKPVYFTLISAGQDGMLDPKTTKSTPVGTFRIFNKQITATMDSNEHVAAPGAGPTDPSSVAAAAALPSGTPSSGKTGSVSASASSANKRTEDEGEDSPGSPFELRDVPYVQYFEGNYALHGAYWHDVFGTARSHGCINLSPIDARQVFNFTEPAVPEGWHGFSIPVGQGTMVVIHK